ncbi:leucine-rich repeat-containing protein 59 isoform X1 [Onthophagus taurus]|uniref:leucine-rich repeat-containing protein 59 isoform X1 n=1 Tax=Onthophagus taurus TaxID=166361 RepID=UPI000C2087F8|nr:leucine-rich repeat-containing protein 59 isoform X1 [Onthophagus taurus]
MSKGTGTKLNLKDKINDGEIDLSLCELQDVPVKEIASIRNIHSLDLSTNHLIKLPNNFVTLTHLTKLDLSKNKLRILPEDFGNLTKLRHLDLYKNEIEFLPLSFHKLKALRWLDLKDNPLPPSIKAITGPCLDKAECQRCAIEVVKFFIEFNDSLNVELKKREEQRQQSKMAKEQAEQKLKIQEKKKKKKIEKKAKENVEIQSGLSNYNKVSSIGNLRKSGNSKVEKKKQGKSCCRRFLGGLFWMVFLMMIIFVGSTFKHDVIEKCLENLENKWNFVVENLPTEAQKPALDFGKQICKYHQETGELVSKVVKNISDMIADKDLFFDYLAYYKNKLSENVNYFYTKYAS